MPDHAFYLLLFYDDDDEMIDAAFSRARHDDDMLIIEMRCPQRWWSFWAFERWQEGAAKKRWWCARWYFRFFCARASPRKARADEILILFPKRCLIWYIRFFRNILFYAFIYIYDAARVAVLCACRETSRDILPMRLFFCFFKRQRDEPYTVINFLFSRERDIFAWMHY